MARSRMDLETHGTIKVTGEVRDGDTWRAVKVDDDGRPIEKAQRWRARTIYRDLDGRERQVKRYATTKAKAETALKAAIKDRQAPVTTTAGYRSTMTVAEAATLWLRRNDVDSGRLAERSRAQYRASVKNHVHGSQIADLTIREANIVSVVEAWLQVIADGTGSGAAKTARSVMSSIMGEALRDRAVDFNAVRSTRLVRSTAKQETTTKTRAIGRGKKAETVKVEARDVSRAFTREERDSIVKTADGYERAKRHDVADVVAFMAGTGTRISEALAVRWEDVDLDAGTVFVAGTKSSNGERTASLPAWLRDRLVNRAKVKGTTGVVFASPGNPRRPDQTLDRDKPRDTRNVTRIVREVLDTAGFTWATSHSFRRSVATIADGAGVPLNIIARSLGQDPATTARFYLARNVDTSAMATAL